MWLGSSTISPIKVKLRFKIVYQGQAKIQGHLSRSSGGVGEYWWGVRDQAMCSLSKVGGCSFAVTGDMEGKRGGLELTQWFRDGSGKICARTVWV